MNSPVIGPVNKDTHKWKPVYGGAREREQSTRLLTVYEKLTRGQREVLHRSRDIMFALDTDTPKHPAVKFAVKLTTLTLAQVFRRQKQAARRASTARHVAMKLSPSSPFRASVQAQADSHLGKLKQATAEIQARSLAARGKLAAAE